MWQTPSESSSGPDESSPRYFADHYDFLFAGKDYGGEVRVALEAAARIASRPVRKVLEVGCGTGNHTLCLASRGLDVIAVDTDAHMLELAQRKACAQGLLKAAFFHGPVQCLDARGFDLCVALFHVVTYIPERDLLEDFFRAVAARLSPGGAFVFDCWNGVAVLLDPPGEKHFSVPMEKGSLFCDVSCETDFFRQKARLIYKIRIADGLAKEVGAFEHSVDQVLWTPEEISYFLARAGFVIDGVHPAFVTDRPAGEHDWKIMFLCRKKD